MAPTKTASTGFQEDQIVGKAFDKRLLGRLLHYATPYRLPMIFALVLIVVVAGLGLAGPFIIKAAIDGPLGRSLGENFDAAARGEAIREIYSLTAIFAGVAVLLLVLRFIQTLLMSWIGQRVMFDLRKQVYSHLIRMPFAFYDRNPVGRLVTRITSDVEALNDLFASGFISFIADILVLVAITLALLWINASLALVILSVLPLLLLATFVFRAMARTFYREQRGHLSHLNAFTQESVQGMNLIQVFHREHESQSAYESINGKYMNTFLKSVLCYSVYFPVIEFLASGALAAVVWYASRQISMTPPTLTLGDFFLFWYFLGQFFKPIRDMAERYNILQSAMAAAERIFKVIDTPETLRDPESPRPLESLEGRVEFDSVCFSYIEGERVLKHVTFDVEPGQTVAIVGATGAGKSTIINLLSRFYDTEAGSIRIDGVDVREYRKADLRARISIVLQDVFIFSRSVKENIRLGTQGISDEDIVKSATHVNASRFIDKLPARYDEVLKERGRTLSVGEKQLLSFARALVHNPDILVLDEATANVDSETEALIQDALSKLLVGRTSIVIAHRLSTIRRADKIVVLHKGEVREVGSHQELIASEGIYKRLYELQYRAGGSGAGGSPKGEESGREVR